MSKFDKQFRAYLDASETWRDLAEESRDFADLKQWTLEEAKTIRARNQAPVVFDYTREQLDYFLGVERDTRMNPRAYPRTKEHEDAAEACTDALMYVADNTDFDQTSSDCFENLYVEGAEACIVDVEKKGDDYEIIPRHIPWDRFYFDPHSRRKDFKDAQYMGVVIWMDEGQAVRMFPGKKADIKSAFTSTDWGNGDTYDDRPIWIDTKRKRIRVCQHYYLEKGEWYLCYFSGDIELTPSKKSPLLDDNGDPMCPIEAQSCYIDRDNMRYGYIRRHIDVQREINHRRSKALFLLSSRQVIAEEGSVADQQTAKNELKKPDGWIQVTPGSLRDGTFQVNPTGDMAAGQQSMYMDAVQKMQASGANAAMQGDVEGMSGRAIQRLQHGGQIQIGPVFDAHRAFKRRIYRQIWARIKQFWNEEKWIRVTDNEDNLKWVGLNEAMTLGVQLEEAAKQGDEQAAMLLQQMTQMGDPRLNQVVETRNQVAEIDVDIILDEAPDAMTSQEEQQRFMVELVKAYGPEAIPIEAMIETSSVRGKGRILDMLQGDEQQQAMQAQMAQIQAQFDQAMQQLAMKQAELDTMLKEAQLGTEQAKAAKTAAEAVQTQLENATVQAFPDVRPNVNI